MPRKAADIDPQVTFAFTSDDVCKAAARPLKPPETAV